MTRDMSFRRAAVSGVGANSFVQYEEILAIEDAGVKSHPPLSYERSLRQVKLFLTDGLDKTALEHSAQKEDSIDISKSHVLCPYRVKEETLGMYTRQDTRTTLVSKVGNYATLQKEWKGICLDVASELGQKNPEKTCQETTWNLPK